ncbi:hypothetical protein D3C76_353500 [compost metagenome]
MLPGDVRRQVDTGDHVAVVQTGAGAIAPGVGGVEAVVAALALRGVSGERTGSTLKRTGAIRRTTTKAQFCGIGFRHAIDTVVANLADQGQAAGAPDLIDELGGGQLRLEHREALVAIDVCAQGGIVHSTGADQRRVRHAKSGVQQVRGIELQRHVRPIAHLTAQRGAANVGLEAQAVETDVLGEVDEIAGVTDGVDLRHLLRLRRGTAQPAGGVHRAQVRVAAVVVHVIGAELGVVQFGHEPAQRYAILPTITRFVILQTRDVGVVSPGGDTGDAGVLCYARGQVGTGGDQTIGAALRQGVVAEEGAAVVDDGLLPLQLVEGFGGEVLGKALGEIEHVDRDQALLDLGTRATYRSHVDRVDHVDAVLDEGALAPAHYLLAEARVARQVAEVVVVVDEGIEEFGAGRLGQVFAATVVDVVEQTVLVLQLEVVPVLATDERTAIAVLQFEVVQALEDLREGLALLEVQAVVVDGTARGLATLAHRVVRRNECWIGSAYCPAGAQRQRRIEPAFDLPDIEINGMSLRAHTQGDGCSQHFRLEESAHCSCCCHATLR